MEISAFDINLINCLFAYNDSRHVTQIDMI